MSVPASTPIGHRAGRGGPRAGLPDRSAEVAEVARAVHASWLDLPGGEDSHRLRRALLLNTQAVVKLLADGSRIADLGRACIALDITCDDGRPLTVPAFTDRWGKIEGFLRRRLRKGKA